MSLSDDLAKVIAIKAGQGKREQAGFFWLWIMENVTTDFQRFTKKIELYKRFTNDKGTTA